jgi:hypothetical protein
VPGKETKKTGRHKPALIEKFLGKVALAMEPPAGVPKA